MDRPELDKYISLQDFKDFYWLKEELVTFGRTIGIDTSGGKIDITERIAEYIQTGFVNKKANSKKQSRTSKFDWNSEALSLDTIITDSYKNTENVRKFFLENIGNHFSFNVLFMNWTKENIGASLKDAIEEWEKIYELKKDKNYKTNIAPQFEYNRYMRAFLADNPDKTNKDAMKYWKLKRAKRGTNEYEKTDFDLK
jgi:hypothetical protein